jgi:hypothetical protein
MGVAVDRRLREGKRTMLGRKEGGSWRKNDKKEEI